MRHSRLIRVIDDADTSIIGNTTSIKLKKSFLPILNSRINYTINFSNPISHPHIGHTGSLISSEFSILDGQDILRHNCKLDDLDGKIRVCRIEDGQKIYLYTDQGTIDYITGKIVLKSFNPSTINGTSLDIIVEPSGSDVVPLREQVILISSSNINLTMTDIGSVRSGLTSQAMVQQTTTTSTATTTLTY
jgi:hypothetical protein